MAIWILSSGTMDAYYCINPNSENIAESISSSIRAAAVSWPWVPWYRYTLLRFNDDGSLDNAFGNQGALPLDFGDDSLEIWDVEQLADGKLLIAGALNVVHGSGLLARMHADGSPDESFGSSGRALFQLDGIDESLSEIMVQADGRIVVLGSTNRTGRFERVLARYTEDGVPDAAFGNSATPGIGIIDVAGIEANLTGIVQQRG